MNNINSANLPLCYFLDDLSDADSVYGGEDICCLSDNEVRRLSEEWETDLFERMHEATEDEIRRWGLYDDEQNKIVWPLGNAEEED